MSGSTSAPTLDLDFTGSVMPSALTFARASIATNGFYTDAPGSTYTSYATNVPRFIGGGLYLEESRTNYLLNSDAPVTQTVTVGAPAGIVHLIWVIGTGSATVTAGTAVSANLPVTATAGVPAYFTVTGAGTVVVTVSGTLTRFQLERGAIGSGSTFPTSYIPTAGVSVTRGIDLCTASLGNWYNPVASTYYVQAMETFQNYNACALFGGYVGASRTGLIHRAPGNIALSDTIPGITLDIGSPPPYGVVYQAAGAFRNGRQAGSQNGGSVFSQAAATIGTGMTTLGVGSTNASLSISGTIYRARYWPYDLANAELQAATLAPVLDYDFTGGVLPAGMSFTRASTATYFDVTGLLQTAATNAPRFDYNPVSHAPMGLLIEEGRTNLTFPSGNQAGTGWSVSPPGCVVMTPNVDTAPDGTNTATSIVTNDTIANAHTCFRAFVGAISTTYVGSVFAKAGAYPRVSLAFGNSAFTGVYGGLFDLTTGTIVNTIGGSICTITPFPNGWYRISATGTSNATGGAWVYSICPAPVTATTVNANYTPASTGLGILTWGAQTEAGAFATSYVPTTTATVTRAVDVATLPVGTWYNTTTGSWSAEFVVNGPNTTGGRIVGYSTSRGAPLLLDGAASPHAGEYDGAVVYTSNALFVGAVARAASSWTAGTALVGLNGGPVASSAALTGGFASATAYKLFADNTASDQITGYFRRVAYWPRALPAAELREATSTGAQVRAMVLA